MINSESKEKQRELADILPSDFSQGERLETMSAASVDEHDVNGLIAKLMSMSKTNNVLVVSTNDESEHLSTCVLPRNVFTGNSARACWKFAELRNLLEDAEEESHATVSIIRYDPIDDFSGVYYSTRARMPDGWRAPLRFKVHRHLVDAIAATKMWRALPFMEYKKKLL